MQTFLVDEDPELSARLLDPKRRFSQIYEGIQILASLVGRSSHLVNPKRDVPNHPVSLMWRGHELALYRYVCAHYAVWFQTYGTSPTINSRNLNALAPYVQDSEQRLPQKIIHLIPYYKALLLSKDISFYSRYQWLAQPDVKEWLHKDQAVERKAI